jgi:hypothetical protein
MSKVIIYKNTNGVLAILYPTQEALNIHGIEAIAKKDVPHGLPYKIIDATDVPSDRSQRNSWTADDADLIDGVGAESNLFEG